MFHWDQGLFLTRPRLALDVRRGQPHGFVSHAHADHLARHQHIYCTPATARLCQLRIGQRPRYVPLQYRQPRTWGDVQLTAFPAGHCLGAAMLRVEGLAATHGSQSLLYTGDFHLGESHTADLAEPPRADVLVMECTFGKPRYRLPPRREVEAQLVDLVQRTLASGQTPIIHAYPLGKSQEATRMLTLAGVPVLQHPEIFALSQIYEELGVPLGDVRPYAAELLPGRAVVTLPKQSGRFRLPGIAAAVSVAITGWAVDEATKYRWQVDHALPLSDHADFTELLELPHRVQPRQIYCTHGPNDFVAELRAAGWEAYPVTGSFQPWLFS
jgi:Cft2 family RNA processing exonuclease